MRPKGAVAFVEPVKTYRLSGRWICLGETRRGPERSAVLDSPTQTIAFRLRKKQLFEAHP